MFSWGASFSAESAKLPKLIPKSRAKSLPKAPQKPSKINEKGGAPRETKKRPKRMPKWSQKRTHNFQEKSKNQPWSAQGAPRDPKDPQSRPQAPPKAPKGDPRDPQRIPKGSPNHPPTTPREPQRIPKGPPKGPQGSPKSVIEFLIDFYHI